MYRKRILLIIALIGVIIGGIFTFQFYRVFFFSNTAFSEPSAIVFVPSNASMDTIVSRLKPLLKRPSNFLTAAQKKGFHRSKGGKYSIRQGMGNHQIINTLRSQNMPVRLTFNNQDNIYDLASRISEQIEADSTSLVTAFKDSLFLESNGFNENTILSMFVPNSYQMYWNTNAAQFRTRMKDEFFSFWNPKRVEKAAAVGLNPLEVVALASIVQKETVMVNERPRVAGVYLNRLQRNMKLQADPTVIFAIQKKNNDFNTAIKRVLNKDLKINSPFNTYRYRGLPPGPISMPDISSIEAVLNPEKHRFLYFVADISRPGYHMFAKTYSEHNRNRRQYIQWVNQNKIYR